VGRHKIIAGFYPATAIAFAATGPNGALTIKINLGIPLTVSCTYRTTNIKISVPRQHCYAVQGVGFKRATTKYDAFFM
jgi:hypothetical protein